jgi:hypothetical protein
MFSVLVSGYYPINFGFLLLYSGELSNLMFLFSCYTVVVSLV